MTDRRSLLRGLAALPFAGAPVALATTTIDPIFAAIEHHRQAHTAFRDAVEKGAGQISVTDEIEAGIDIAFEVEREARYDMHQAVPTTMAGLMAYVTYWTQYTSIDYWTLEHDGWEAFPTIAEALQTLSAAASAPFDPRAGIRLL